MKRTRLEETHERISERLSDLADAVAKGSREGIEDGLSFLRRGALRHHEDEEESLFPRLAPFQDASELLSDLCREHQEIAHHVEELARALSGSDDEALHRIALELIERYRGHVAREDERLLPLAKSKLGEGAWADIEREMEGRRGGGRGRDRR